MKKLIFVVVLIAFTVLGLFTLTFFHTSAEEVRRTLHKQGFTDVLPGATNLFECGEGDKQGRDFEARNPQGTWVTGVVCCGNFKSCTVRW